MLSLSVFVLVYQYVPFCIPPASPRAYPVVHLMRFWKVSVVFPSTFSDSYPHVFPVHFRVISTPVHSLVRSSCFPSCVSLCTTPCGPWCVPLCVLPKSSRCVHLGVPRAFAVSFFSRVPYPSPIRTWGWWRVSETDRPDFLVLIPFEK